MAPLQITVTPKVASPPPPAPADQTVSGNAAVQDLGDFAALVPNAAAPAPSAPSASSPADLGDFSALVPKGPQVGRGTAALDAFKQGASFGFSDELAGVQNAGTSGMPDALKKLVDVIPMAPTAIGAARLALQNIFGAGDTVNQAYQAGRDEVRARQKAGSSQFPVMYGGAEAAGALTTLPFFPEIGIAKVAPKITQAAPALERVGNALSRLGSETANSAATGAVFGAAQGAGEGEGATDTLERTAVGGLLGGAVGGVAPAVIGGAGAVGGKVAQAVRELTPSGRARSAAQQVVGALEADRPGMVAQAPRALEAAGNADVPLITADLGGTYTHRLADASSIRSPAANKSFAEAFGERDDTARQRLIDETEKIVGGKVDSAVTRDALTEEARRQNGPAYTRAYAAGDREINSPELERLTAAPYIQRALSSAISKWKNYAVRDGFGAMNPPFRIENGGIIKTGGKGGMKAFPNIQLWDYAARDLQDKARAAPPGSEQGKLYNDLARLLKTELDKIVPEYKVAREGAAGFFGAQDALEAGEKFAFSRMKNTEAQAAFKTMKPAERELFGIGMASQIVKAAQEAKGPADVNRLLNKIAGSPGALERLKLGLGPDGARRLEMALRLQNMMNATKQAVTGNSKTAQRFVDAGLMGAGIGIDLQSGDISSPGSLAIVAALSKSGRRMINERIAAEVGRILASRDPNAIRKAAELAVRNPGLFQSIRNADNFISRLAAPYETGVVPAAEHGRADEQK